MTFSQSLNPHSFVVFMTLAMGISYVFFNTRQIISLGKIIALLILVVPFVITGFERGHVFDIGLGTFIGWITARGGLGQFGFVVNGWVSMFRNKPSNPSQEQADSTDQDNYQQAEAEFQRRQQQAERERENTRRKKTGSKQKQQNNSSSNSNQSQQKSSSHSSSQKPQQRPKTKLEKDCELLGVTATMTRDEAKKMYRKLITRYHQDKLAGLPEEHIKKAEEEAKKINTAWDRVKKARKWR